MKRFDQARPFATLAVAAVAWILLPTAFKAFVRAGFFEFTAPVQTAASSVPVLRDFWSLKLHTQDQLIEAGRDLARREESEALAAQQNTSLREEVARLEQQLNLPPRPGFRYETARVAERDFAAWWQRLVICKGSDAGIPVGAAVVYSGGVVGRVAEVHATMSVVELVSSPNVRLAAFIEGDTRPVSYQGAANPAFGNARGTIEYVPLDIYAKPGAPLFLVTSGLGAEFPPGLAIGKVVRVVPSGDGLFKTGEVVLDPALSGLTEVTVLVPVKR